MNKIKTIKSTTLIAVLILIVTLFLVITTSTFAVWKRVVSSSKEFEAPVDAFNPSLKHLIFTGLNSSGEFSETDIVNYAVVGYDGLVGEVIIPSLYENLPVVKITTDPSKIEYKFSNNEIITSLVIPLSIMEITTGTFQSLENLKTVNILGTSEDSPITIGFFAFGNCRKLASFKCDRQVLGESYVWI